jgi:aryl-alcohol dehydrogenase-like predicted oxidoreductase
MKRVFLGASKLEVSELCLGTMLFNKFNQMDSNKQLDFALDSGINFLDTAEMYPVNPISKDTIGVSEEIIGDWMYQGNKRDQVIIATKIAGEGNKDIRNGEPISSRSIKRTIEASLRRLKTDYIDLYQLHWPNRGSYMFRKNWSFDPSSQKKLDTVSHIEDTLGELKRQVDVGNVRYFGLSNESAWGTSMWLRIAEGLDLPKVLTIQNEYSLLCRLFDTDLAELCVNEDVTLLGFSPLAAGYLTGKYQNRIIPKGSRMFKNNQMGGRASSRVLPSTQAYLDIAKKYHLDPIHMSLAWYKYRPFKAIPIIGATNLEQLQYIINGVGVTLKKEVLQDIDDAHKAYPMPY